MPRWRMCPPVASWRGKSISRVIAADSADHSKAFRCSLAGERDEHEADGGEMTKLREIILSVRIDHRKRSGVVGLPEQQGMAPELTKWSTNFTLETLQDTREAVFWRTIRTSLLAVSHCCLQCLARRRRRRSRKAADHL